MFSFNTELGEPPYMTHGFSQDLVIIEPYGIVVLSANFTPFIIEACAAIQQLSPITTGLGLLIVFSGLFILQRGCPSPSMIVTFQPMLQSSPKAIRSPQDMSKPEFGMNPFPISTHPFTFNTEPQGMSSLSFIFNIDLPPRLQYKYADYVLL